jgi:hypothetical protein
LLNSLVLTTAGTQTTLPVIKFRIKAIRLGHWLLFLQVLNTAMFCF